MRRPLILPNAILRILVCLVKIPYASCGGRLASVYLVDCLAALHQVPRPRGKFPAVPCGVPLSRCRSTAIIPGAALWMPGIPPPTWYKVYVYYATRVSISPPI